MTSQINVGQIQGITPTNEITVPSDTKLVVEGILRSNTIQTGNGLTVASSSAGGINFNNNLSTSNNISASQLTATSKFQFASWTTSGRPGSPSTGTTGYNSTNGTVEFYNGTSWVTAGAGSTTNSTVNIFNDGSCIALWQLNGNGNDLSGSYNGSPSNVSWTDSTGGQFGQAGIFNGSNSTMSVPNVKNSYPLSVSLWATHNRGWTPSGNQMDQLFNMSINGQRLSLGIVQYPGWRTGPTIMYGGTNHWSCSNLYMQNDSVGFYHIVYIIHGSNNSNHRIYINGVNQEIVNNGGGHGGSAGWNIGSNSTSGEWWPGKIDQIRFFNRVITESEVLTLFAEK